MGPSRGALRPSRRFVPVSEERCGQKRRLGPAAYLHEFLVAKQTAANGQINRGRAISYAWIRARWPGNPDERPTERTLQRWMRRLKAAGMARVWHDRMHSGMYVELVGSVKFAAESRDPAQQIPMFGAPLRFPQASAQPVESGSTRPDKSGGFVTTKVAAQRSKEELPKKQATAYAAAAAKTTRAEAARGTSQPEFEKQLRDFRRRQMQRRLLREIVRMQELYRGAQDAASLARRDERLSGLYEQLQTTGWQDERAG